MSRIGKKPITILNGVTVDINGNEVTVKGAKGTLKRAFVPEMKITMNDGHITVERPNDEKRNKSLHGLTRTLINNMIIGVTNGYEKTLEINGVGYKAAKQGKNLNLNLGYSHPVVFTDPEGIETQVPDERTIIVKGIDKEKVGQYAAEIRAMRGPEPYKGKGIKYKEEHIIRKVGKTGKK
ncbi:MAG: 50S ribosomal protein L6 [Lachnospiraceae bacterium]|nr:50S ribosomal protein L6 [Lachnospiraceae bacterium]